MPPGHVLGEGTPVVGVVETGHAQHAEVMVEGAVLLHEEHDVLDRVEVSSGGLDGSGLAHRFGHGSNVIHPGQRECGCGANPPCQDLPPGVSAIIRHHQMFAQSSPCFLGVHSVSSEWGQSATESKPASSTRRTMSVFRFLAVNHLRRSCPGKVPVDHFSIWSGGNGRTSWLPSVFSTAQLRRSDGYPTSEDRTGVHPARSPVSRDDGGSAAQRRQGAEHRALSVVFSTFPPASRHLASSLGQQRIGRCDGHLVPITWHSVRPGLSLLSVYISKASEGDRGVPIDTGCRPQLASRFS